MTYVCLSPVEYDVVDPSGLQPTVAASTRSVVLEPADGLDPQWFAARAVVVRAHRGASRPRLFTATGRSIVLAVTDARVAIAAPFWKTVGTYGFGIGGAILKAAASAHAERRSARQCLAGQLPLAALGSVNHRIDRVPVVGYRENVLELEYRARSSAGYETVAVELRFAKDQPAADVANLVAVRAARARLRTHGALDDQQRVGLRAVELGHDLEPDDPHRWHRIELPGAVGVGPTHPAGWYPSPESADLLRYWNGTVWTSHTAETRSERA